MRKTFISLAIALPAFALLQGCATTPGLYGEVPYTPPPGYILVPVPQDYGNYAYYYYGAYPYQSPRYYWPFYYSGYVGYGHHPRPKAGPPCRQCDNKHRNTVPSAPGFIPRGKPISHFYWGGSPPPAPPAVRPSGLQPEPGRTRPDRSPKAAVPPTPPAAGSKVQQPPRKRHENSPPPR